MKRNLRDDCYMIKLMAKVLGFALLCLVLSSTAYSDMKGAAGRARHISDMTGTAGRARHIQATGHVQGISVKNRSIQIDNKVYILSDDLVVKDKKNNIMIDYALQYFATVDLVEYVRVDQIIIEIKIIRSAS